MIFLTEIPVEWLRTLFPSFCSMLYKDALCAQGTGEDGVDADFHLIDFSWNVC